QDARRAADAGGTGAGERTGHREGHRTPTGALLVPEPRPRRRERVLGQDLPRARRAAHEPHRRRDGTRHRLGRRQRQRGQAQGVGARAQVRRDTLPDAREVSPNVRTTVSSAELVERSAGQRFADDVGEMLREQHDYRELLYQMTRRDLLLRYKQTVMGFGWAVFMPVINTILFSVVFMRVAPIDVGVPYPVFAYTGLLAWNFF